MSRYSSDHDPFRHRTFGPRSSFTRRRRSLLDFKYSLLIGLIVLAIFGFGIINATHVETHHACKVVDKDRTSKPKGGSDMRVYTDNCGNFSVDDSILSWTWHSSDTYREVEVGHTYDFKTRGFRIPFFSAFPNIVEVQEK